MAYNQVNDGIPTGALPVNTSNNGIPVGALSVISANNGLPAIVFTPGLADQTEQQKAAEYNNLIAKGFTDSQIKAAADTTFGTQSASDWSYLTNLAGQSRGTANPATVNYSGGLDLNAGSTGSTGVAGVTQQAAFDPISNLYTQYAGRAADAGGLDYWRNQFGTDVDANEAAIFQRAVAENVAKGVESTATGTNYNDYFTANPDVAAEYMRNTQGMTPEQFAASHYQNFGVNEGRAAPGALTTTSDSVDLNQVANTSGLGVTGIGTSDAANSIAADTSNISSVYKSIYGVEPTAEQLENLTSRYGTMFDPNEISNLVSQDTSLRDDPRGVVKTLQQQILDQGTTKYWTGEAFGSAEKTAADMARMLASAGITDINQFGKVTVPADAAVTPVYGTRKAFDPEYGEYDQQYITGYTDANGKAVDPSLVRADFDENGTGGYIAPVGTKEVFGNKETGVALDPSYDRAQGNIFSGTFAGKGSTGYGVQFKEDGTPVFYTQYGGSTNTLNQIMSDLGPLGQIAFAVATGGLSIPQQIAAQAALSLASGTDLKDVVKNIAVSTIMQGIPGSDFIKEGAGFLNTIDTSGALGKAFTSAASSGAKAVLTNQDVGDAILSGAIGGGTAGAIDFVAGNIPGFSDLSKSQQNMVKTAISGVTSGQPLDQVLINTAIDAGKNAVRTAINDKLGETAFVESKRTGASDQDAFDTSNVLTKIADANETFDGSGFDSKDAAMNAALADGKDKFTFDGKKFTIDNSAAVAADYTNSVLADAKADTDLRTKSDTEFGDLAGAQSAATARNTVAIGNAEANDLTEAAALAKIRDPSATSFTFDGKTYNVSASQSEMAAANKAATLAEIKDLPKFSDAYAQARTLLGPNQTFEWNGKQYSTATAQERPDLSAPKVQAATDESAAETARLARQNAALVTGNAPDQSAAETARFKSMEKTGFFEGLYKDLNDKFKLQGEAANEYLKNNPNSPITASVSSAFEAAGELQKNLGGVALAFDNKPLADAIIKGGSRLQDVGQSIGSAPEDTKNWNDTLDLIGKAKGTEKLAVLAGRVMDGTSGLARQVGLELRQELPALFLGGGSLKATMIASGLIDTADTGGGAVVEAYDNAVKSGKTHEEALSAGRKAGGAAAATEAAIQLTLGKLADIGAGKLDNIISKGTAKVAGEGVVEGSQEAGASAAVDLALGNAIDVNKALTQGVVGAAVGKGTAATTSPVDAATTVTGATTAADTTAANNVANNINTAIASGDTQNIGSVITENVTTSLNSGASANVVVDSAITSAITGGADAAVAVDSAITSAINSGASVDSTIGSAVTSAVKAGADVNTVIDAATQAAVSTGNNVTIASDANIVTINNATTNTNTAVNTATGVTTTVDNANNVTTTFDGNTTTAVDANNNITSQTKVDGNTQTTVVSDANANTNTQTVVDSKTGTTTSTTVDNTTKATTQTTITGDTQTTVLTDPTTNTQTTVKTNINTGEVIDTKETEIPSDWKQPEIKAPEVKPPVVESIPPTAVADSTEAAKAKLKLPKKGGEAGIGGGAGLPLGIGVDPASLRSRVTEGAIDPLARVKQAQAELERDVMMNQIDPRLLSVMQQRMDPQQQAGQLDNDVGALAKMLRGDSEAPANESKYYSYGSEDSIDDILGGKAANYKEGGYVQPLMAAEGGMALPLLAKSGGALGKYNGREDFKGGKHVAGDGDGQSDDIPAWLADGEFVFPADVVSALGNGSTKAGTDKLYEMMHNIRDRARSKGPKDLPPPAMKSPLDYLKSSKRSTK